MVGYSWTYTPPDQVNPILDRFLHSLGQAAAEAGYRILAAPGYTIEDEINNYEEFIKTRRVDGFVVSGTIFDDPRIAYLLEHDFPFVAFGRSNPEWDFPWVDVDGTAGTREATEHLLSLGHTRIVFLGWTGRSVAGSARLQGYEAAMEAADLAPRAYFVPHSHEGGYTLAQKLLREPKNQRPTALVCVSDLIAIGAMNGALDLGVRIPDDLAVAGFDDAPMTQYLRPCLTTLRQPITEVGERITTMLLRVIDGETLTEDERHALLPPRLIVRRSTHPSMSCIE
jgi:DNA-binding LacI/PurR family transcriptional regulator